MGEGPEHGEGERTSQAMCSTMFNCFDDVVCAQGRLPAEGIARSASDAKHDNEKLGADRRCRREGAGWGGRDDRKNRIGLFFYTEVRGMVCAQNGVVRAKDEEDEEAEEADAAADDDRDALEAHNVGGEVVVVVGNE
jgi:hypothetical protein